MLISNAFIDNKVAASSALNPVLQEKLPFRIRNFFEIRKKFRNAEQLPRCLCEADR